MKLLLDTHVLIWWDEGRRLSSEARRAVNDAEEVFVSAASAWEVAIKVGRGRLRPTRTVANATADSGFVELPVTFQHASRVAFLPLHHGDPFDRLLAAQAEVEGLTLVTSDPAFEPYEIDLLKA